MIFLNKIESQADKHQFHNSSNSQIWNTANECIKLNQMVLVTLIWKMTSMKNWKVKMSNKKKPNKKSKL